MNVLHDLSPAGLETVDTERAATGSSTPQIRRRVAVVTGGTRGIGLAVARRLLKDDNRVVATFRSNQAAADTLGVEFADRAGDLDIVRADVSNPGDVAALVSLVASKYGRLDLLVSNAGCTMDGALATMQRRDYEPVVSTNLTGTIRVSLALIALLRKSANLGFHPAIVIISSMAGVTGKEGQASYAATKGGLIGLTRLLARTLGDANIRVNSVAPGFIRTRMVEALEPKVYEHVLAMSATARMGEAEEVAGTVAFLGSLDAAYVNGNVIRVDGGFLR